MSIKRVISFHPELVEELGDVESVIFFQQLLFWSDKGSREDGFIYKTQKEIQDETSLSRKVQDRVRKNLIMKGWVEVKKIKANGSPTLHYKLLRNVILTVTKSYVPNVPKGTNGNVPTGQMECTQRDNSITEITTEITPHTARAPKPPIAIYGKTGEPIELTTGNNYQPDFYSPRQKRDIKKRLERALGINRSTKWSDLLFGAAWDFLAEFKKHQGYAYAEPVLLDEVAKNLASFYERGETRETLRAMTVAFFSSEKAQKVTITPTSVFSTHTYNSWKQGKLGTTREEVFSSIPKIKIL